MLLEGLDELSQQLLPLVKRGSFPCGEGLLCGGNGVVEVLVARNGDVPELLASCRVDAVVDLVGAALLAVDDVVELVEVERGHLSGRHDCGSGGGQRWMGQN